MTHRGSPIGARPSGPDRSVLAHRCLATIDRCDPTRHRSVPKITFLLGVISLVETFIPPILTLHRCVTPDSTDVFQSDIDVSTQTSILDGTAARHTAIGASFDLPPSSPIASDRDHSVLAVPESSDQGQPASMRSQRRTTSPCPTSRHSRRSACASPLPHASMRARPQTTTRDLHRSELARSERRGACGVPLDLRCELHARPPTAGSTQLRHRRRWVRDETVGGARLAAVLIASRILERDERCRRRVGRDCQR